MNNEDEPVRIRANCAYCGDGIPETQDEHISVRGSEYCDDCHDQYTFHCDHCEGFDHEDNAYSVSGNETICPQCRRDHYDQCSDCGEVMPSDQIRNDYCEDCLQDRPIRDQVEREVNVDTDEFIDPERSGAITQSARFFSAEIEAYYPSEPALEAVANAMPEALGISGDGSLNGERGIEFQTPRLAGQRGEDFIKKLCGLLNAKKFKVDRSCGLHIHLDGGKKYVTKTMVAQRAEPKALKALMMFYLMFDDVILSFLPVSRRNNRYCIPMRTNYSADEIKRCQTLDDLEALWYKDPSKDRRERRKKQKYDDTRYSGINFHSMLGHNHLEIRFHSGTMDSRKILFWVALHVRIMDVIEAGYVHIDNITGGNRIMRSLEDKTEFFFDLIGLNPALRQYYYKRQEIFTPQESELEETKKERLCAE